MTARPAQEASAGGRGVWHLLQAMHTNGNCVGTDVPHKWFPLEGFTPAEYDQYAAWACEGCPVRDECLTYAIETRQLHGVWGGMAEHRIQVLVDGAGGLSQVGRDGHPAATKPPRFLVSLPGGAVQDTLPMDVFPDDAA